MEPGYRTHSNTETFFRRRYNPTIALTVGLLLFLLPFAHLKCGKITLAENTGVGMVMGKQWNVSFKPMDKELFGDLDDISSSPVKKGERQWYIFFAAMFAVCGLIISFIYWDMRTITVMCCSLLAALLMAAGYMSLKMQMRSLPFDDVNEYGGINNGTTLIRVQFTAWYFISAIAFVIAAIFSYKQNRIQLQDKQQSLALFDFQKEEGHMEQDEPPLVQ